MSETPNARKPREFWIFKRALNKAFENDPDREVEIEAPPEIDLHRYTHVQELLPKQVPEFPDADCKQAARDHSKEDPESWPQDFYAGARWAYNRAVKDMGGG